VLYLAEQEITEAVRVRRMVEGIAVVGITGAVPRPKSD
jgi:hypothetical protein